MTPDAPTTKAPATIAALLTRLAPGAIAVVGVAGPGVDAILGRVLRRAPARVMQNTSDQPPRLLDHRPTFCQIVDEGAIVDDVVVVRIPRGDTTTAEINTHGGVRIAQRVLMLMEKNGARIVDADAFVSLYAEADLIERDVDRTLLGVSSRRLTHWLLTQRRILPGFLRQLDSLGAHSQTAETFVAQGGLRPQPKCGTGVPPVTPPARRRCNRSLREKRRFQSLVVQASRPCHERRNDDTTGPSGRTPTPSEVTAFHERSRVAVRLIEGLRVALIGPVNAGKSTLANRLIGADRVITSDQPGTTRDWVSETALVQGWPVTLTDTAGIRNTNCEIEAEAIRRARRQAGLADLVVIVLDATVAAGWRRDQWVCVLRSLSPNGGADVSQVSDHEPGPRATGGFGKAARGRKENSGSETPFLTVKTTGETPVPQFCHGLIGPWSLPAVRPSVVVMNKWDIAVASGESGIADCRMPISGSGHGEMECPLRISALKGTGIDELESRIASLLGLDRLGDDLPTVFLRHQLPR
ncbi:MAG: 50S ribosome-binding GTPase [Phycisphaerae bacterium]|nr:50S ribosome-binding GTPase [Phycisphaerae bacterium]